MLPGKARAIRVTGATGPERPLQGIWHHVSKKHLLRRLNEAMLHLSNGTVRADTIDRIEALARKIRGRARSLSRPGCGRGDMKAQHGKFDWVTTRNDCTAERAFEALKAEVMSDVRTRIEQAQSLQHTLSFRDTGKRNRFSVVKDNSHSIEFVRSGNTIRASHVHLSGARHDLAAVDVGMNEDGDCTLTQGGKELHSWQFRRIALDDTFCGEQ